MRPLGPYQVAPTGFGAMRLTGPGVFGPPSDRAGALAVLREAVDRGVDHIDTAQFYGPRIVNELIREALHPYPAGLVIVSKVASRGDVRGNVLRGDDPAQLRRSIEDNLRTLALDELPIVNLRLLRAGSPDAYFEAQLAAMVQARDDGLIRAIGLSNIARAQLLHALRFTEIACVQNFYNVADRTSQPVLDECARRGIAFVPFGSLGAGASVLGASAVIEVAARLERSPAQIALAWALEAAPNVLLIPGTSSVTHLRENLVASTMRLDADALQQLERLGSPSADVATRHDA